jgi:predicted urease superfamily metal-dependent hydrolase
MPARDHVRFEVSQLPEQADNLEELKAEIEEGFESAKKLVEQARLRLNGEGNIGEAEQS